MGLSPYTNVRLLPVGASNYIVVKNKKVIRTTRCVGAGEARAILQPRPTKGEKLYIEVGR